MTHFPIKTSLIFILYGMLIVSCSTQKNNRYFQDLSDTQLTTYLGKTKFNEPRIQSDDILSVFVTTLDPAATLPINSGNMPITNSLLVTTMGPPQITGYLVDKNGEIEVPVLGKIKVAGLTTTEAKELVRLKANKFFNSPNVTVRFTNFHITVLGEVARPSSYIIPNEKVSILDALGYAGDLTVYAKRENVLLLRMKDDGTKEAYRLDLTNSKVLSSPYFYLKQQDVIYVEAKNIKVRAANSDRGILFGLLGTVLTLGAIFIHK